MRMLKLAVDLIEHLLIMTSTQGVMISTSSYQKTNAFDGERLDEFPTASLDSGQCQLQVEARGGPQVTWLSDGSWTVFQKVLLNVSRKLNYPVKR